MRAKFTSSFPDPTTNKCSSLRRESLIKRKEGVKNYVADAPNRCHSLLNTVQVNFIASEDVKELYI